MSGAELHKEATPSPGDGGGVILRTGVPDYEL